jgi:hypothetical protein
MDKNPRLTGRKPTPDSVIYRVLELLPDSKLSYRAIGEDAGCSISTVKKIKDGTMKPSEESK